MRVQIFMFSVGGCAPGGIRTHTALSGQGIGLETGFEPVKVPIFSKQDFLRQFTLLIKSLVSTIPPPGHYFNELTLLSWGDSNPASISCFRGRHSTIELQDFLLFGGYCKSSLLNHSGTAMDCHCGF